MKKKPREKDPRPSVKQPIAGVRFDILWRRDYAVGDLVSFGGQFRADGSEVVLGLEKSDRGGFLLRQRKLAARGSCNTYRENEL